MPYLSGAEANQLSKHNEKNFDIHILFFPNICMIYNYILWGSRHRDRTHIHL
jgi:hypothetical protein